MSDLKKEPWYEASNKARKATLAPACPGDHFRRNAASFFSMKGNNVKRLNAIQMRMIEGGSH